MKNQLSKSDRIKIYVRKEFLKLAHKKIDSVQVGDMNTDEFDIFSQEISEITDFLVNKDKYMEAMEFYKTNRNKNVNRYFKER